MRIRKKIISILVLLVLTVFNVADSYGQDKDISNFLDEIFRITRENLSGLKKVSIFVSSLGKAIKESGVTEAQLQKEVEIRLRRVEIYDEKAQSHIYINITAIESDNYSIKCKLEIALKEPAQLERNNSSILATTWERIEYIEVEKNRVQNVIRDKIGQKIDQFIDDYQADNSKIVKKKTSPPLQKPETTPNSYQMIPLSLLFMSAEIVRPKLRFSMIRIEFFTLISDKT